MTVREHQLGARQPNSRGARERILQAAYALFSRRGVSAVGVDSIIAQSGVAKLTLYRHFHSKEALVLAFWRRREAQWTHAWLEAEMLAAADSPAGRLLSIFDVFDRWFQQPEFEGRAFINVLLEAQPGGAVRSAAAGHLAHIREVVAGQARAAGLAEIDRFAQTWHFLMKGCIVAAQGGNRQAGQQARAAAAIILANWPRD